MRAKADNRDEALERFRTHLGQRASSNPDQEVMVVPRTVDAYVKELRPEQRRIVDAIRQLVKDAAPESTEAFKWAEPVFELDGPFAWVKAYPNHVTFGFWRGVDVDGGIGILESSGSKMAHMKLRSANDIDATVLSAMVRKAVKLNRKLGDPSKTR